MKDWILAKRDYIGMVARVQCLATQATMRQHARSVQELMTIARGAVERHSHIVDLDGLRRPLQPYLDHVLLFAFCCIVMAAVHDPATWLEECSKDYPLAVCLLGQLPNQTLLREGHLQDLASVVRADSTQTGLSVQRAIGGRGTARVPAANVPQDPPSTSMLDLINDFFGQEIVRGMG